MSPRPTWLATRSAELRSALLDLGLTITDTEAQKILDNKVSEYAALMRVTRQTAQRDPTDQHRPKRRRDRTTRASNPFLVLVARFTTCRSYP